MKIVSWNVNGIRAIARKGLFEYIASERPDVFCAQETRADPQQLDAALLAPAEYPYVYYAVCAARKGYSGVGVWSKRKPKRVSTSLGAERFDVEGRVLELDFEDFVLLNVYFPNGGMEEKGRLQYKLDFYDAFLARCAALRGQGRLLVACGDYNTARTALDLARPKENETTSGFLPIERAKLDELAAAGYADSFREFASEGGHYSWWSYRQGARARNIGWRIDYCFLSRELLGRLQSAFIQPNVLGSDHCPVGVTLAE